MKKKKGAHYCRQSGEVWICDEPMIVDKPIIYIYPEKTTSVSVKLGKPDGLLYSYPSYEDDGWNVLASPDGKLTDLETGDDLYALYWEGEGYEYKHGFEEGFCISKSEIVPFLEEKLDLLGLNYKEKEEFIIYWLPILSKNEYIFIRFAGLEEINEYMPLEVLPQPDNIIRILMQYKGLDEPIKVTEQNIVTPTRTGFTVVEWGGTEIR